MLLLELVVPDVVIALALEWFPRGMNALRDERRRKACVALASSHVLAIALAASEHPSAHGHRELVRALGASAAAPMAAADRLLLHWRGRWQSSAEEDVLRRVVELCCAHRPAERAALLAALERMRTGGGQLAGPHRSCLDVHALLAKVCDAVRRSGWGPSSESRIASLETAPARCRAVARPPHR